MKLNEPGGFLVSSLNSLGFRQQVKSKEIQREKKKKNEVERTYRIFTRTMLLHPQDEEKKDFLPARK